MFMISVRSGLNIEGTSQSMSGCIDALFPLLTYDHPSCSQTTSLEIDSR